MTTADAWAATLPRDRPIVVTGAAGFVGFHLARRLLRAGFAVVGLDNLNDYYDVALKEARVAVLGATPGFTMVRGDLADRAMIAGLFADTAPRIVFHLAAQAGVRYSLKNPHAYADSNLTGFLNIVEACRHAGVSHLLYASSSSVYGGNVVRPFAADHGVDHPVSLYAATKKANELMAHAYSHLFGLPATGLRFFTVYGPWGRPDMAYWLFADAIWEDRPITVYNGGDMARDFTYIDDVVEAVLRLAPHAPTADPAYDRAAPDPSTSWAPHRVFNIGNTRPESLMELIRLVETAMGREARKDFRPMEPGDVERTWADTAPLEALIDFKPTTPLAAGIDRFVTWHRAWRSGDADLSAIA